MKKPWENDSCETVQACFSVYHIPVAAALWCGVPAEQVAGELRIAVSIGQSNALGRAILRHPYLKCLEPRIRAIHAAIDSGDLQVCREDGRKIDDHVAYERRHVYGLDLKEWAKKIAPTERPAFLFDQIERDTHSAISVEAYRIIKAANDAKDIKLSQAHERIKDLTEEVSRAEAQLKGMQAMIDGMAAPGIRAETTYENIIGGLLGLMVGKTPAGKSQSVFENQSAIIYAMLGHYPGKPGISARTLEDKFAAAKKALAAT